MSVGPPTQAATTPPRRVFIVLSARFLPYGRLAIASLFRNAMEPVRLTLITDSAEDKGRLAEALAAIPNPAAHGWEVFDKAEADGRAAEQLRAFPEVLAFREGHPCWRKVTDPPLFAEPGGEIILLDPDVYFPNRFTFEPTPARGLRLMWQPKCCLFPPRTVIAALDAGYPLVNNTDIGAANIRGPLDWAFIDGFLARLRDREPLPRIPHVESIVWAAVAAREGGGYLDPVAWKCWVDSQVNRVRRRLKRTGAHQLSSEDFRPMKLFHAGGLAKEDVVPVAEAGLLDAGGEVSGPTPVRPFRLLDRRRFEWSQSARGVLRAVGYYRALGRA